MNHLINGAGELEDKAPQKKLKCESLSDDDHASTHQGFVLVLVMTTLNFLL